MTVRWSGIQRETSGNHFDDQAEVWIDKFGFEQFNRQINHITGVLDRWTILERIKKDDSSIAAILPGATPAQMEEYLKTAMENQAVGCTALLLNYKQEHFAEIANSHFPRPAGPHFPASQGHIKRPVLEISRVERVPPLLISIVPCPRRLCLLNQYGKPCSQPAPDSVKLAVAFLLITQLVSPFIRRILAGEEGGCPKVIPKFDEMVQDLDPFLGVSADCKVINEQQLDPCIVPDPLTVLVQIFLPVEDDQFVQQIAIVYKLAAVIAPACLYTTGRQEIGLSCTGDSIDPYILPVLSEVEFQDLLKPWHHYRCDHCRFSGFQPQPPY